ncbi:MAG: type I methionyl aminopeptidase [Egibacteraceae bacterium]
MVVHKTPDEIVRMALAGRLLAEVHERLAEAVQAGVTTADLDELAEREMVARGGRPSFKGYHGYPAAINTSINHQVVHGIPSPKVRLRTGDVLTVDAGVVLDGYHADSARTYIVGGADAAPPSVRALVADTLEALWRGIDALRVGNRLGDVSAAIGDLGAARGYGIIADHDGRSLGGHGIGRQLHEDPIVLNRGRPGRGLRLRQGLVFAIEPMFTLGGSGWQVLEDGWTTITTDGSIAAHWEHTVAVTEDGPLVLTGSADEAGRLRTGEPGSSLIVGGQ